MTQVRAVIFDLGNVLVFHDNALLFRKLGERAGLSLDEVAGRFESGLWDAINRGEFGADRLAAEVGTRLGVKLGDDEFFALWNCHFQINQAVLPSIEALVGRVKLLLLSNTNALHARYLLPQLPLLQRFDALLLSHELGFAKPDPRIFARALAEAGTAPEETAFFDDLPEYVAAARGQGIRAQLFASTGDFPAQLAALGL